MASAFSSRHRSGGPGRYATWVLVAVLLALLLPVGVAGAQEKPRRGGTMIVGLEGEPTTTNPILNTGSETGSVASNVYDQLLDTDLDFNIKPRLAEKWEVSADGKTYTFRLFKNAQWTDGKPVTSEDVKFSMEMATQFHPRFGTLFKGAISQIRTPDPNTVEIVLNEPFAPFLGLMATGNSNPMVIPKHIFGDGQPFQTHPANMNPIGSGPFKVKKWVKGSHVEFERNEKYHLPGLPYLDGFILQFLPDANSRWIALEKGEVDYLNFYMMPLEQVGRARANPNLVVEERGAEGSAVATVLMINMRNAPLAKREVRQALAYSIDKKALIEKAFMGLGQPAHSVLHAGLKPLYTDNVPRYDTDLNKAGQLLDAAGYPKKADGKRFSLRMVWATGREVETPVAEMLRDQFRQVGVEVELQKLDRTAAIDKVYINWDFDVAVWSLATGPDPNMGVTRSYHSNNIKKVAFTNVSAYVNPEADALFDSEFKQVDPNKRTEMWHKIQQILLTDLPNIPLVDFPVANVYNKRFHNVVYNPFQTNRHMMLTWADPEPDAAGGAGNTTVVAAVAAAAVVLGGGYLFWRRRARRR